MNILVISNNYPSRAFPNHGAFVYNLMQELALRHQITLISPYKAHHLWKKKQETYGDEKCDVFRPIYFSLSNKKIAGIDIGKISNASYGNAVHGVLNKLRVKPDIIYAHFLANTIPVLEYANNNHIPIVVASGESTYAPWADYPTYIKTALIKKVNHIICVSKENQQQLLALGFNSDRLSIVPNAVNYKLFRPLDKTTCKKKLGLSLGKFTIGFVGHFIHRKGPNRIIEAIESLNDRDIQLLCVGGKGSLRYSDFTHEMAPVPNFQLPEVYNAFDVFVLPTLGEGHCNVIEEAKACGIPVISSRGTSVEEQIDDEIGILIDPMNIQEIAAAISVVKANSALRKRMSDKLVERRGTNSLSERAKKIESILARYVKKVDF